MGRVTLVMIRGKSSFLKSIKIALISIVAWIIFSLVSNNHYIHYFIPLFIETLPRTNGFYFLSRTDQDSNSPVIGPKPILFQPSLSFHEGVKIAAEVFNCGLSYQCASNSFPITLTTGQENQQCPYLCIAGKVVLKTGVSNCGRGINVAVIDNVTRTVTRVVNFDTYGLGSANLETMLLTLLKGEIIVMATFDEPSSKLSTVARLLLHELGSSQAQNLQFRSSWYLITYKGLNGYSPHEDIAFPGTSGWGKTLSANFCLPFSFEGQMVKPDTTVVDNQPRIEFCETFGDHWPLFCDSSLVNDPLVTSKIYHPLPISPEILRTPVVVINQQCDNRYFPLLLDTLLRQPELRPNKVMVAIPTNCHPSLSQLIKVFNFEIFLGPMDLVSSLNTILDHAEQFYRYAHQVILVDGAVVLAPDFLPFMGQLLPFLHYPNSKINFISAWNENGFTNTSTEPSLVYRVDNIHYPIRLVFMIRRGTRLLASQSHRSLWSLKLVDSTGNELANDGIIPDQSRVLSTWPILKDGPIYNNDMGDLTRQTIQAYDGKQERGVAMEEEIPLADVYSLLSRENYIMKIASLFNESDKFESLEAFESDYFSSPSKQRNRRVSLICQKMDHCHKYCQYFGLAHCHFQFEIPRLGNLLRFTFGSNKTMLIFNVDI